jgi:hypothetical protein
MKISVEALEAVGVPAETILAAIKARRTFGRVPGQRRLQLHH